MKSKRKGTTRPSGKAKLSSKGKPLAAKRRPRPVDRSVQGAALAGTPNVPETAEVALHAARTRAVNAEQTLDNAVKLLSERNQQLMAAEATEPLNVPSNVPDEKKIEDAQKGVDTAFASEVNCLQSIALVNNPGTEPEHAVQPQEQKIMSLTFSKLNTKGTFALYTGAANVLRIPLGAFPNKTAPPSIAIPDGVFAGPRQAKALLTAEEKAAAKVARAALPKPTLAEIIERRRKSLAALEAKEAAARLIP